MDPCGHYYPYQPTSWCPVSTVPGAASTSGGAAHFEEDESMDEEVAGLTSGQLGQSSPSYSPDPFDFEDA